MTGRRIAGGLFWIAVAASGLALAAWALSGPLPRIRMNSPMNAASCFGLALILCLAARAGRPGSSRDGGGEIPARWLLLGAAGLVVLTAAVFGRALHFPFLSDDFIILKRASPESGPGLLQLLKETGGDGFFRPLTTISLALSGSWAGLDPAAWRVSGLFLHLVNSLLVLGLASRLGCGRLAALFAAALFALHGTRPEAVVWIAGRPDLLSASFVLGGLLLFALSLDEAPARGRLTRLVSLLAMAMAILSKETAYVFPLLALVFLTASPGRARKNVGLLIPFFAVAAGLFAWRLLVLGGIGGYAIAGTGQAQAVDLNWIPALKALSLRLWAVLFFPVNWSVWPGIWFAAALIGFMGSAVRLAWTGADRRMIFPLGIVLIAALPPLHLLSIGADMLKSRLLYLPSAGFSLLLALAADRLRGRLLWAVPGMVLILNLSALHHNLDVWEYVSERSESACALAAESIRPETSKLVVAGLPEHLLGVYFFGNGFPEGVEMRRGWKPFPIELRLEQATSGAGEGERRLVWDPSARALRPADP